MEPAALPRRVTIVDVASHANVSTTAVSKVLRNAYGVSPSMREKVTAAIAAVGTRSTAAPTAPVVNPAAVASRAFERDMDLRMRGSSYGFHEPRCGLGEPARVDDGGPSRRERNAAFSSKFGESETDPAMSGLW